MHRRPISARLLALLSLGLAIPACGGGEGTTAGTGGHGGTPVPACDVHATKGVSRFTDRSDAWGLTTNKIVGNRIVSGDLDGDGYPDLIIHAIGGNNRETVGMAPHLVYVLMNEPAPGGGRTFVDRTAESGYGAPPDGSTTQYRSAHLAVLGDVDGDGDLDIFSGTFTDPAKVASPPTAADQDRSQILLNDGKGHFSIKLASGVSPKNAMTTTGASFVDIDRDGKLDLFLGSWYANNIPTAQQLLTGNGDGTFTDISLPSGVRKAVNYRPAYGITTCDVDGDGVPELLVSGYGRSPNILFVSDAPNHYVDQGVASTFAYDDDMHYQDNEFFKCYCSIHATDADCAGVGTPLVACPTPADSYWDPTTDTKPPRLGGNTFTTVCSDITGDGKLDLFNAEIHHWWAGESSDASRLLTNVSTPGKILFDRPDRTKLGMDAPHATTDWNEGGIHAAAADLDNDGREDVILGLSDYPDQFGLLFHQKPDGTFEEIGESAGFHHPCVSGITIADFDRDGDLDIVVGSGTARDCGMIWKTNEVHFYENDASQSGHFLLLKLKGDGMTANTSGIGARVVIDAGGTKLTKVLTGGYGHMAMGNDTVLFFGLGGCGEVKSIEVTWPDAMGTTERFEAVMTDRLIELRQGDKKVYDVTPKP